MEVNRDHDGRDGRQQDEEQQEGLHDHVPLEIWFGSGHPHDLRRLRLAPTLRTGHCVLDG
jgi:hypothetical protein